MLLNRSQFFVSFEYQISKSFNSINTLVKYHVCNHSVIGEKKHLKIYLPGPVSYGTFEKRGPDQCPIMAWLNIGTNDNHLATSNTIDTLTRLPKQFIREGNSPQKFRAALQSRDIQRMIHDFLIDSGPDRNINTSLDAIENIILTTAKRCLKIKVIKKRHVRLLANKKWFDKDCRLKRHELRKLANLKHRDALNITLREKYHTILNQYKSLLKDKRK